MNKYHLIINRTMHKYKKIKIISEFGQNGGLIYQAIKQDKKYFVYEFEQYEEAQAYNFKVLAKLMSSHVLSVCEEIQQNGVKYVVTDYAEKDLLQSQTCQPNRVFPLPVALDYFSKIILALEQMHENKLVYRNVRPQVIKLREDNVFLYDFTLSQFCKRKQRMFDVVGCQSFLAPEFFSEDGYSFQVDIWAAGVVLFFMLTNDYPFKFKNKTEKASQEELMTTMEGFSFQKKLQTCKNPGFIKTNKILQDFFCKIFTYDYTQRLTIKQIKNHKLMAGFFPQKLDKDILEAIGEEESNINSLLMTRFMDLQKFKISRQIQKEQIILDFIERCSESLMLDCADYIPQQIRGKAQFAILKVAMIKINNLIAVCYDKKKPDFQYDEEEFQLARSSSAFKKVIQNIEKRQKILYMLYKSAYLNLKEKSNDPFYSQQIPEDFNLIKISYRGALSQMFEAVKPVMTKNKSDKALIRKITEVMARMVIMHLINRIFQPEDFEKNFALYISWNKDKNISNLDGWIHGEKHQALRQFIKETTKNYL